MATPRLTFNCSSSIWHHIAMPDEHQLTLRQADQARADFAIEAELDFISGRAKVTPKGER
jgi:hypothetical protein